MQLILDVCQTLPEVTFAAGKMLLAEGTRTGILYILVAGKVEVIKGNVQIHVATQPGAVFGEISALLDIPHTASVRTMTACRLYVIDQATDFLVTHQEIAFCLSQLLARRLYGVTTYLADLKTQFEDQAGHLGFVDEVLETLLHQQEEKFRPGSERHPDPTV